MKKTTLAIIAVLCFAQSVFAQPDYYDTSFGNNGVLTQPSSNQGSTLKFFTHQNYIYAFMINLGVGYSMYKYSEDGVADTAFNLNLPTSSIYYWSSGDAFQAFAEITDDGKILVAHHSLSLNNNINALYNMSRYTLNGGLDTSYGSNGRASMTLSAGQTMTLLNVYRMQGDDLIAIGYTDTDIVVNKFNSNGQLYTGIWDDGKLLYPINQGINYPTQAVYSKAGNCMYVSIHNLQVGAPSVTTIIKLDLATGLPDVNFGTSGILTMAAGERITRFTLDEDDNILVGIANGIANTLRKYNSSGALITVFGDNGAAPIVADGERIKNIIAKDGEITIVTENYNQNGIAIYKYDVDANAVATFGESGRIGREEPNGTAVYWAFDYQETDQDIIIGGSYSQNNSIVKGSLFKFLKSEDISSTTGVTMQTPLLYPNPAKDAVFVKYAPGLQKAEVYNPAGQLVVSCGPYSNIVPVSGLPTGFYMVRLYGSDEEQYVLKLQKE